MFAEAGSISLELIRFTDTESYDVSALNFAISTWAAQVNVLIMQRRAFAIPATWSRMMYEKLCTPRVFVINGNTCQIGWAGPPPADVINESFELVHAWVALAIGVIHAEFPSWSILQSFSVFNPASITPISGIEKDKCLPRLAALFNVSLRSLSSQYDAVLPAAMEKMSGDAPMTAFTAWRSAILEYPRQVHEFRNVVLRLGTWSGMTTSGVEHVHSMQQWLLDGRRGSLSEGSETTRSSS